MVDRVGRYDIIGYGVFLDELAFGLLLLVSCCLLDVEVRCSLPIRRLTRGDTSRHYFVRCCMILYLLVSMMLYVLM